VKSIEKLISAGMDVARLNLSHGDHRVHSDYIRRIRSLGRRSGIKVAILMDLPGPKYRIGRLKDGKVTLKKGTHLLLTIEDVEGDSSLIPVTLPTLSRDVKAGDTILLDDGALELKALKKENRGIVSRVIVGGVLTERRGLVVPGMKTSGPFLTETLQRHLTFAAQERPDYIALSFVSSLDDLRETRNILRQKKTDIPIVAKIERGEAVKNFDKILSMSDGIMVARGDLGVDIPLERVPLIQKEIIWKCNKAGKPVITATQMLESMVNAARPTRAEVTDIANAIFDGTDATMLSSETSVGKYPAEAVRIMSKIAVETEKKLDYGKMLTERGDWLELQTDELISYNACHTAHGLEAAAIVALTQSGSTAGRVSKYRPKVPVLAITSNESVSRKLLLRWGVFPFQILTPASVNELFTTAARLAKDTGLAKPGDLIIITGGIPVAVTGTTNLLKVEKIQ
jgi:pyruvate kinase